MPYFDLDINREVKSDEYKSKSSLVKCVLTDTETIYKPSLHPIVLYWFGTVSYSQPCTKCKP